MPGIDTLTFAQGYERARVKVSFLERELGFVGRVVQVQGDFERVFKVCRFPGSVCNVVRSAERETQPLPK